MGRVMNRICPRCGSAITSEILWGMPAFTDALEQALAEKKIVLGGCCVTGNDPTRHCHTCRKNYDAPFQEFKSAVNRVSFSVGGYCGGYHDLKFERSAEGGIASHRSIPFADNVPITIDMDKRAWNRFLDAMFKCMIMDWKRNYKDPGYMDGTQWELVLEPDSGKPIKFDGSNNFPPALYWERLLRMMSRVGFGPIA